MAPESRIDSRRGDNCCLKGPALRSGPSDQIEGQAADVKTAVPRHPGVFRNTDTLSQSYFGPARSLRRSMIFAWPLDLLRWPSWANEVANVVSPVNFAVQANAGRISQTQHQISSRTGRRIA